MSQARNFPTLSHERHASLHAAVNFFKNGYTRNTHWLISAWHLIHELIINIRHQSADPTASRFVAFPAPPSLYPVEKIRGSRSEPTAPVFRYVFLPRFATRMLHLQAFSFLFCSLLSCGHDLTLHREKDAGMLAHCLHTYSLFF